MINKSPLLNTETLSYIPRVLPASTTRKFVDMESGEVLYVSREMPNTVFYQKDLRDTS